MKGETLEVQVQQTSTYGRQLSITVPAESVQLEMERIIESYRRRAALPGFRKGKVPSELVRVQFHGDIESDLLDRLIPDAYREALKEAKLDPVAPGKIHDVRFSQGQALEFKADLEIHPDLEATGYRGLELEQEIIEVDDAMVAEALEALRRARATNVKVDRPAGPGDVIAAILEPIDVSGKKLPGKKREEIKMEAGSPTLLPEFREVSVGLAAGDVRTIEVHYPEELRDKELAGKTRRFRLTAREIQEKILPELDDNFARSVDPEADLEKLKSKLRLRLEAEEMMRSKERLEDRLVEILLQRNPISVPQGMVTYRLERAIERSREETPDLDEDSFRQRFAPIVERLCRREILFGAVTRQESLAVSEAELEAELDGMAQDAGVEVDVLRKKMEADRELDRVLDTLQERKVLDFLVSSAQITRIRKPRLREQGSPAGA